MDRSEGAAVQEVRLAAMPEQARAAVEAMACLGGRADLSVLRTAAAATVGDVADALGPAIEDGLLVLEPGAREAVRFRHDRTARRCLAASSRNVGARCSSTWRAAWRRCPSCSQPQRSIPAGHRRGPRHR